MSHEMPPEQPPIVRGHLHLPPWSAHPNPSSSGSFMDTAPLQSLVLFLRYSILSEERLCPRGMPFTLLLRFPGPWPSLSKSNTHSQPLLQTPSSGVGGGRGRWEVGEIGTCHALLQVVWPNRSSGLAKKFIRVCWYGKPQTPYFWGRGGQSSGEQQVVW